MRIEIAIVIIVTIVEIKGETALDFTSRILRFRDLSA